jgi:hypothetical protein
MMTVIIDTIAPILMWAMDNRFEIERLLYNFKEFVL